MTEKRLEKPIKDKLPEPVLEIFEKKWYGKKRTTYGKVYPGRKEKYIKYSKPQFLRIYMGYDFMENLLIIRPYILKKHKINMRFLELLLYLAPMNYFNYRTFFEMPKGFTYNRIQKLIDEGWIMIFSTGKTKRETVYKLTPQARNIVVEFYQLLAGEKKIPEKKNPFVKPTGIDKLRNDLIKKLNQAGPSENKKKLFGKE